MTVSFGEIVFSSPGYVPVRALLGDGTPGYSGGVGGWSEIERPKRQSLTEWVGTTPHRLVIPILIDGFADGVSVQAACDSLQKMGEPQRGLVQPPTVSIEGAVRGTSLDWVIEDIEWGEGELRDEVTELIIRQPGVVSLLELVQGAVHLDKKTDADTTSSHHKTHIIKKGETLDSVVNLIAGKKASKATRTKLRLRIKKLNKIRDAKYYFAHHIGKPLKIT